MALEWGKDRLQFVWLGRGDILVPEAYQLLPGSLEHLHLSSNALVCGKCVKPGLILPWGTLTPAAQPSCLSNPVQVCCP